jgi:hypothetical protein
MNTVRFIQTLSAVVFANDNDAFVPEVWAQESLAILEANLIAAQLVHRDFQNKIAAYGDVVNTRRPAEMKASRKVDGDQLHTQDAQATNVAVTLDQHIVASFMIYDKEASLSFAELKEVHLEPAVIAMADFIDQVILGHGYQFMGTIKGQLGTNPTDDTLIDTREAMTNNKCPLEGRNLIISPDTEGAFLKHTDFVNAHTRGDDGSAMREGHLGRLFGFDIFTCHNVPAIASGSTTHAAAVNMSGGAAVGETSITIDGTSETLIAGSWCTIAGDMTPQKITAVSGTPTTSLTISPGLATAVDNNAVVTVYAPGQVNNGDDYAAAWNKRLIVDGFSVAPKTGQLVTFASGATAAKYSVVTGTDSTGDMPATTGIMTDRSLQAAISDNDYVALGPAGTYNFAFRRNSLALVMRPLQAPDPNTGARSYVASYKGLGLRVTITYDGQYQGHRVTVDVLAGIQTLDSNQGAVLLS